MDVYKMIPKLIRAGVENDKRAFEIISLTIGKKMKKMNPEISDEINRILCYKDLGTSSYRSIGVADIPVAKNKNGNLVQIDEVGELEEPILPINIVNDIEKFILEQNCKEDLLKFGVKPANSILLSGEPGVGKTYTAKWISQMLNKPLITLNLATVVSSLLGETGNNIKSVIDYAKQNNGILFLDEFDAIAKRRDDERELGELKRIVNVLLKELEEWPMNSIVIAATNHPELLDKAIWRRFDYKIEIPIPDYLHREAIIQRELGNIEFVDCSQIKLLSYLTQGINAAEIVRLCSNIKKDYILFGKKIDKAFLYKIIEKNNNFDKVEICKFLKNAIPNLRVEDIAELTNIPTSSIYRYLKK